MYSDSLYHHRTSVSVTRHTMGASKHVHEMAPRLRRSCFCALLLSFFPAAVLASNSKYNTGVIEVLVSRSHNLKHLELYRRCLIAIRCACVPQTATIMTVSAFTNLSRRDVRAAKCDNQASLSKARTQGLHST